MFPGCIPELTDMLVWVYWFPTSVFQCVLLVLAIAKIVKAARQEWQTPKLLIILVRDSLVYFGGALAIILVNACMWSTARVSSSKLALVKMLTYLTN